MEPIVTIAAVIIGGAITAGVTWILAKVDIRRRHRLEFLIATYHDLYGATARELTPDYAHALELALERVFLFGNAEQLRLAARFREEFAANGHASLDALLLSLRRSVRRELALNDDKATGAPWIRVGANKLPAPPDRSV